MKEFAFPTTPCVTPDTTPEFMKSAADMDRCCSGLEKREYYAAAAMQGLLADPDVSLTEHGYAVVAARLADELALELAKEKPDGN